MVGVVSDLRDRGLVWGQDFVCMWQLGVFFFFNLVQTAT